MEADIAIMMADLSGYTALTETHGPASAADLIDKYLEIVETCLAGNSRLHERTGDEVMIISDNADHLLATAMMILERTHAEENFLQLHGGLHYGKVLKRKNSYFGSAINLTSRIAAKADPGSFWCSGDFVTALSDPTLADLNEKGKHTFKNVSGAIEVFEISNECKKHLYIDPICRMLILDQSKAIKHLSDDLFFCSEGCLHIFTGNNAHNTSGSKQQPSDR